MFEKIKTILSIILISFFGIYNSFGMEREENINTPTGVISAFAGEEAPKGWLICDGKKYSSKDYPKLYDVIKTKYVPQNEKLNILEKNENNQYKLFCVPDLIGRVIVGVDSTQKRLTNKSILGSSGGEEFHTLTTEEMPNHSHTTYPVHGHEGCLSPKGDFYGIYSKRVEEQTTSIGGGKQHNNMQPFIILNYIIKN